MTRWRPGLAGHAVDVARAGVDLMIPTHCGGCDLPGIAWCAQCAATLADSPVRLEPRVKVGVPAWALGRYRGPHRAALIAVKEHGRRDLVEELADALARGLVTLAQWGEIPDRHTLTLVPAPTRAASARRRGGDPVTAIARAAAVRLGPRVRVAELLVTASRARDSAGLDARGRVANLTGAVHMRRRARTRPLPGGTLVLVDDILTTGATAAEASRVLSTHGLRLATVVVIAGA
ncbi:ComF family protein [Gordonia aquimaris]|uniref:ComF family protein n=1 Tax=Gordonia aquimaris TaxID=2984863 RepID=A0A9X3D4X8_9ACTN|nr:ComF family protein [Gordonia aquimaris]MCX2964474.1 ComF family protein [Gordonia aquimaris]